MLVLDQIGMTWWLSQETAGRLGGNIYYTVRYLVFFYNFFLLNTNLLFKCCLAVQNLFGAPPPNQVLQFKYSIDILSTFIVGIIVF